ncbi:pentatricopeptide repeat-containing protein At3g04130, mitochondrial [Dioscorea cayenensis subsp. rotundata]|uniref:Pentatricopeptide repeat-containing protein At3g04130, mitochondrial n=1 Tax=Dioscorea cayennensis subsp. rotundata TaxID=55577 RepID=A0AB40BFJ8_DIOCR|nr:pentatricopeptide repeat-containing protein At3g04130, mitochondrial [Dioscorea cayenensis subsp. rotundata]
MLGRSRQFNRMWDFSHEIRARGSFTLGTVAKIMRRLVGAGRWRDAVKVFDDLPSLGFEQDVDSMNLLLDALCKDGKVEVAREVFAVLKSSIFPNAHTFNIIVHGWCCLKRLDEAKWTLKEFEGYGFQPSVITYSTLIKAYCGRLNFDRVYELLDEMESTGCPPNVVSYTIIMKSIARSSRLEEAAKIFERMRSSGCKPDTYFYNCLINTLGKAGQVQDAIRVFEIEMPADGVVRSVSTYNTMISVLCQHDQERDALKVLKEMENSSSSCSYSLKPDLQTFTPLLKMCFKTTVKEELLSDLLNEIVNKNQLSLDVSTYSLLIHGLCKEGKIEWACNLFEEMIGFDISPRFETCRLLLDEAGQRGLYDIAERIKSLLTKIEGLIR